MHQNSRGNFVLSKVPRSGGSVAGGIQQWNLDDFLGLAEHNHTYSYVSNGSSKVSIPTLPFLPCLTLQSYILGRYLTQWLMELYTSCTS